MGDPVEAATPPPPPGFVPVPPPPAGFVPAPAGATPPPAATPTAAPPDTNLGGVDTGNGGILSKLASGIGQSGTLAGQAATNPDVRSGMETSGTIAAGPLGAEAGNMAGAAVGLGKWGMALARAAGTTVATAPLSEKDAAKAAGFTFLMNMATEGALAGGGQFADEAAGANAAAKVTGAMTPAKIQTQSQIRDLLQAGGKSPEEVDSFLNGASEAAGAKTRNAYNAVIKNARDEFSNGYNAVFDAPTPAGGPLRTAPVDTAPITQKIDELQGQIATRGAEDQESAALKKFLNTAQEQFGANATQDGDVKAILAKMGTDPDTVASMSPGQLDNFRTQFEKNGLLTPNAAPEQPTVEQMRSFRTNLRDLRTPGASNTTKMVSNQLEAATNDTIKQGMTAAGATPDQITSLDNLDQQWRTFEGMRDSFHNVNGADFGHQAANAIWSVGQGGNYEALNHFFTLAQTAAKVDPEVMPALRESFLTKLVGDARDAAGTDLNGQKLIMRQITDTFRQRSPQAMEGMFGADSPFADVRQFSNVMGKSVDPNTTNKLSSTLSSVLSKPAKMAAYGGSGYFLWRMAYSLATGGSPWQDLQKNPAQFAQGMAATVATGAIASLVLTRGAAAQQRAWANMMLNPQSADAARAFAEAVTPLVSEHMMKTAATPAPAPTP